MKFFKPTLVAVALLAVAGCQEDAKKEEAKAPVLDTQIQKQAYGLGASIGMYMQRNLVEHDRLGLMLDKELIVRGFVDSIDDKSVIEQEEIKALMVSLDETMKAKQQEMALKESEASLAEGKKFLEENAKKEGVMVTESGIQYSVLTEAEGDKPAATDTVKVHYKGTFLNGETFDSSYDRGEPATFPVNGVIQGWQEALKMMKEGSKWRIVVPANLAYGPRGAGNLIGPNETLIFEIEVIAFTK